MGGTVGTAHMGEMTKVYALNIHCSLDTTSLKMEAAFFSEIFLGIYLQVHTAPQPKRTTSTVRSRIQNENQILYFILDTYPKNSSYDYCSKMNKNDNNCACRRSSTVCPTLLPCSEQCSSLLSWLSDTCCVYLICPHKSWVHLCVSGSLSLRRWHLWDVSLCQHAPPR
jgi:hypothetical protein